MKISLDWLREYVAVDLPRQEILDKLTMIGLVADTTEERDGDLVMDLETYANRPDTLGHLGVAREMAALLGLPLIEKDWPLAELPEATTDIADVQIVAEALCPRYCGIVVRNVPVGPSPDWLTRRIEAMGLRPVNNVVDVSNYVLFATAQPIHTFDFGRIGGGRIVVRKAKRGETLVDLDGRTLALAADMLVIADESRPVALAGVIGGQASGITESTRDVFIESANFDPVGIRKTAKALGLSTDASYRFERGADIGFAPQAALMAASLLTQMGGRASRGLIDRYPRPPKATTVRLRLRRIAELLGVEVPESFVVDVLGRLGFRVEGAPKGPWRVEVPTFRVDVSREADLIEEIARFYGYDRIPSEVTPVDSFAPVVNRKRERLARIRETLAGQGLDEVINWSFADPEREAAVASGRTPVAIQNPISNRASVMRTSLFPGLLENAAWNLNRGLEGVHIFELGNVFYWGDDEKHREDLHLGLLSTGLLPGAGFAAPAAATDFYVRQGRRRGRPRGASLRPGRLRRAGPSLVRARPGPGRPLSRPGDRPSRPPAPGPGRLLVDRRAGLRGRDRSLGPVREDAPGVRVRAGPEAARGRPRPVVPHGPLRHLRRNRPGPGPARPAPARGLRARRPVLGRALAGGQGQPDHPAPLPASAEDARGRGSGPRRAGDRRPPQVRARNPTQGGEKLTSELERIKILEGKIGQVVDHIHKLTTENEKLRQQLKEFRTEKKDFEESTRKIARLDEEMKKYEGERELLKGKIEAIIGEIDKLGL